MIKSIIAIITFTIFIGHNTLAEDKDCNQYDKLSKEYTKCNSLLLKNKTLEIKENTSKKALKIKDDTTVLAEFLIPAKLKPSLSR